MGEQSQSKMYHFEEQQLLPAEEKLEVRKKQQLITIGIPAHSSKEGKCLPLTPQAVEILVNAGHEVFIESEAGLNSRYLDVDYSEAGANIEKNKGRIYQCDYIIKVSPFTLSEIDLLKGNQVVLSMLHINSQCKEGLRKLIKKKVTSVAFEYMKDELGNLPVMQSISEISGIVSMTVASELLSNENNGKGVLLGGVTGISPASIMILGADTAAQSAARAAIGLGAEVKVFDHSISKLRQFENHFIQKVFTSLFYPRIFEKALTSADVVIGAMPFNSSSPHVVSLEQVQSMKKGSIIIDLNASQGGCFETTRCTTMSKPTYVKEGIIHYCVPNIAARVSRTTTIALSNIFTSILLEIAEIGGISHYIKSNKGFRHGVYIYNGILTNKDLGNKFDIPLKDLDLLLSAF